MERRFTEVKVWVNGTFDVLHIGHIKLLEFASKFGEVRVGIDTDERVKQLKGESRPINNISDRIDFMNSIKYVHSSVDFSTEEELCDRINEWNTDIIIIGSDYKDKKVIGSHLVKEVIFFDKIDGYSSTKIIESK
jgi:D-beta-D-heptose 7-phosphate kinase/D-beta-D-heptose 1-phosphate adenosyltransferase